MKKKITNIGAILAVIAILAFNLKTTFNNDSQRYNLSLSFLTASADNSSSSSSASGEAYLVKTSTMCSDGKSYATGCTGGGLSSDHCSYWYDTKQCEGNTSNGGSNSGIGNTVPYNATCNQYGHNWCPTILFKTCSRCGMSVPL